MGTMPTTTTNANGTTTVVLPDGSARRVRAGYRVDVYAVAVYAHGRDGGAVVAARDVGGPWQWDEYGAGMVSAPVVDDDGPAGCQYGPGDPMFYGPGGACDGRATVRATGPGGWAARACGERHARLLAYRRFGDTPSCGQVTVAPLAPVDAA